MFTNSAIMKRGREEYVHDHDSDTAKCLMLLSKVGDISTKPMINAEDDQFVMIKKESSGRVFKCKTCNREFPSFQALGGHRASHKKIQKLASSEDNGGGAQNPGSPPKPKTHECSICGLEFAIGQALGGHMRRHRQHVAENSPVAHDREFVHDDNDHDRTVGLMPLPVLKQSSSSKRVCLDMDLDLDLHLGPPGDHHIYDLKLRLMSPTTVGC